MKNLLKTNKTSLFALCSLLFVLLSCEQPFKAGLGPIIDLQDPTISPLTPNVMITPKAGSYIRREVEFRGTAKDDTKLDSVWFAIANYPDLQLTNDPAGRPYKWEDRLVKKGEGEVLLRFYRIIDVTGTDRDWNWKFKIDTLMKDEDGSRVFADGNFQLRLMAIDHMAKKVITDEILYVIKNDIPLITIDGIRDGMSDGDLGGDHLNYNYLDPSVPLSSFKRVMPTEGFLSGTIEDLEGINRRDAGELFPPQIRFWRIKFSPDEETWDKGRQNIVPSYMAGEEPSLTEVPWATIGKDGKSELYEIGEKSFVFNYPLPDVSGAYYGIQVRAQSIDEEHSEAEYPRSYINFNGASPAFIQEHAYVVIVVREPLEYPALELYKLQDIFGEHDHTSGVDEDGNSTTGRPSLNATGTMEYDRLKEITNQIKADGNHVYIDKSIITKGGAFTLRMKASHSGGIASAKVYWEKQDKSAKGRFIWDYVERPYDTWWQNGKQAFGPDSQYPKRTEPYFTWGLNEPDGNITVRSFVFTYWDDAHNRHTPSRDKLGSGYYPDINGMSKVQQYAGTGWGTDDSGNPKKLELDELPEDRSQWSDVNTLDEGTYNLYVYATSTSGTRVATPYTIALRIDRTPPEIKLTEIEGRDWREGEVNFDDFDEASNDKNKAVVVNGVIRPKLLISDSLPTDTSLRAGTTDYFKRADSTYFNEQAFILIHDDGKSDMDKYLANNPWPEFTVSSGGFPDVTIPANYNVKMQKTGPFIASDLRIKTSRIYSLSNPTAESDSLQDGIYWVYVFARDNAFNVRRLVFPINVKLDSDNPKFDWETSIVNTGVTEPDSAYDKGGSKYNYPAEPEKSFIIVDPNDPAKTTVQNKFSANSAITVKINDDDSLDLGVAGGAASGVEVTFVGSKPNDTTWEIEALSGGAVISLKDIDLKTAFLPQTVNAETGKRIPVRERTGTISQQMLLKELKDNSNYDEYFKVNGVLNKDGFTSLPDGIYRVGITIKDDISTSSKAGADGQSVKLKMDTDTNVPDAIPVNVMNHITPPEEYFWFAIDSKNPGITIQFTNGTGDEKGDTIPSGRSISKNKPSPLQGFVTDENGPITLVGWSVYRTGSSTAISKMGDTMPPASGTPYISIPTGIWEPPPSGQKNPLYDGAKWVYKFRFEINMNNIDAGSYDFELQFKDRFGNLSTKLLTYSIDTEPPKVSLTKPIETFSRPFEALVDLKPGTGGYPQNAATDVNLDRLAVKVVNFSINVVEDDLEGVHWWLLPWNAGATSTADGFNSSGIVSDYFSWPVKNTAYFDVDGNLPPGTYYPATTGSYGGGAFGSVDVSTNRQFTIAIDTEKMQPVQGNGEYRLHIIARDRAGNVSVSVSPSIISTATPNYVFQEVFFLHEEDRPFFGEDDNITPGTLVVRNSANPNGSLWPTLDSKDKAVDMQVMGGNPIIQGTVYENNGFFRTAAVTDSFWDSSIIIWFCYDDANAGAPLPSNWETLVENDKGTDTSSTIPNYVKKRIPQDVPGGAKSGLSRQGRNLSLAIDLSLLFPEAFNTDGRKRYIIKATDSPINKLWYNANWAANEATPGSPMGVTNLPPLYTPTPAENESVRVSRHRQFAFIYDAVPPKVEIINPRNNDQFGYNFASDTDHKDADRIDTVIVPNVRYKEGFNLAGSISDMNLDKKDGAYYFEYYLDSNTTPRYLFKLENRTGVTVTLDNPADPKKVNFNILPSVVASPRKADGTGGIIPQDVFNDLTEGQHTLSIFAWDKSGKEGAAWVTFVKDMEPPTINFSNLESKPYSSENTARVDTKAPLNAGNVNIDWWASNNAARQPFALSSALNALPLTTIYYDTGIPELRGNIEDAVSEIDISVGPNALVGSGDVNLSGSEFMYWIDNDSTTRYNALIDGAGGKSVRWTILLTKDGTMNTDALPDGIHTIRLTAKDKAGIDIPGPGDTRGRQDRRYTIAFRIDSKQPRSHVVVTGAEKNVVYGNTANQNSPMFTLTLTADDANLDKVELRIVRKEESGAEPEVLSQTFYAKTLINPPALIQNTWTYYNFGSTPSPMILLPSELSLPKNLPANPLVDDYVLFKGTYGVPKFESKVADGKYEVIVVAYDTAKNKSEEYVFPFTYDKSHPEIVFTNPDKTNANTTNWTPKDFIERDKLPELTNINNINRLTSENLRIQGRVEDMFSPVRAVQSQIWKWNWMSGEWEIIEEWKDIRNDLYYPDVDEKPNPKNNKLLTIQWTKNLLGQERDSSGTLLSGSTGTGLNLGDQNTWTPKPQNPAKISPEGLYRIQVRAKDSSIIPLPPNAVNGGNDDWTYSVTNGEYSSSSKGNPIASDYVYFYYDRANPELKITKINGGETSLSTYFPKPAGGFIFEGIVTDSNRFAKVEVKFVMGTGDKATTTTMPAVLSRYAPPPSDPPPVPAPNPNDPDPPTLDKGGSTQSWKAEFKNTNITLPDGRYTVTVTVYDMTGRSNKEEMKFILDSTPPGMRFTGPTKELKSKYSGYGDDSDDKKDPLETTANGFASVYVQGGQTSVITGETWDRPNKTNGLPTTDPNYLPAGETGSESGVSEMWFHLGFISSDGTSDTAAATFPTKTAIKKWEDTLIRRFDTSLTDAQFAALTADQRNAYMDQIADARETGDKGNAWFKLGGTELPTGFIINNPNVYDWRMEIPQTLTAGDVKNGIAVNTQIGGLKLYCEDTIQIKGRTYYINPTAAQPNRRMVRLVEGVTGVAGIYRLPLWVRLVDKAGNVEYYCHDIWINKDGDIPSTSIESPSNAIRTAGRGGTISVDGVAKSNTSVYDVIFRVFVDGVPNTNLNGDPTPPGTAPKTVGTMPVTSNIVRIKSSDGYYPYAEPSTVNLLPNDYRPQAGETWQWQRANLTLTGGSGEPLIPWSIMLNSEDQLAYYIDKSSPPRGFQGTTGNATPRDTVRVWLEVFVFNGEGSPIRSSIYPPSADIVSVPTELYGTAAMNPSGAKPYVRAFYIKTGAAQITHPNVGTWSTANPANQFVWDTENMNIINEANYGYKGAGTQTRKDRFGFKAILDPAPTGSSKLGEVAYRLKLDGGAYSTWTTVYNVKGTPPSTLPVNSGGVTIQNHTESGTPALSPARQRYDFIYAVNSTKTNNTPAPASGFAALNNGNWEYTGGTVTLQVRMRDDSTPPNEAEQTIQVSVDNFTPLADIAYKTNRTVAGSNVDFFGRVYDYANPRSPAQTGDLPDSMTTDYTPRKLDRVHVWFTKGGPTGPYVNMNTGLAVATPPGTFRQISATPADSRIAIIDGGGANDAVRNITLTNRGGTPQTVNVPGLNNKTGYEADFVRDISESTAGVPGRKMLWSPVNSAVYDVRWSLTLDSTLLPDGDLTMHYVVVDTAGNASYYTQGPITVKNKYPQIERITLYTQNLGIGAAYTQPDQAEYVVNDYRSKMFANYTSSADYAAWNPAKGSASGRLDSVGYLNSGFISKNNYIGFKVETVRGNRPLNFRLQHVTRERVSVTKEHVQEWLDDMYKTNNINLYTIAWHGDYSSNNWKALGVHEDNPTLGTHFVLQVPQGSKLPTGSHPQGELPDDFKSSTTAEVWKYTLKGTTKTPNPQPPAVAGQAADSTDPVVFGPDDNFRYYNTGDFASIDEKDGSHPADSGDVKKDDPKDTAFFLIRVWDSVGGAATTEALINEKLHDAIVIGTNIYKNDTTPPVARLYDLNPYTEAAVTENNLNATIRDAANPIALGSNIVRGGLYNVGSARAMVRSGFIDPRGNSRALNSDTANPLKNGLYDKEPQTAEGRQLISGVPLPDYPLKVGTDVVPASGNDKVSGSIILRGLAWDDQLIYRIQIQIGAAAPVTILQLNTSTAKMVAVESGLSAGQPVAFAAETLNWKTGHTVEWAYVWNTPDSPANNVAVRVIAVDYRSSTNTPGSGVQSPPLPAALPAPADTNTAFHNQVNVDIVPYITGFVRKTPEFTTKRSLQGWFSFYQGESGITVKGYNFGTGAAGVTTPSSGTINAPTGASPTERTFSIPANAVSGPIEITFSSQPAYNNNSTTNPTPTTTKSWNREYNTYTPGSELWTNRHYAHIWTTADRDFSGSIPATYFAGPNDTGGMDSPAFKASPGMSLQYNGGNAGTLHAVWARYNLDSISYGDNRGAYRRLNRAGDPYAYTDMDYYNNGDNNFERNVSTVASYQRDGGPRLILRPTVVDRDVNGGDDASIVVGAGTRALTGTQMQTSSDRWKNPRIRKLAASTGDANPGTVLISAFDEYDNRLHYTRQSGDLPTGTNNGFGQVNTQFFLDGGGVVDTGNTSHADLGGVSILAASITANNAYGNITRSNNAGRYSAIDYVTVDGQNRPVIAYYDEEHQTVRLLYANTDNPTQANQWTRRYLLPASNPLRLGSGQYISMKINRSDSNRIHLAFYNSTNKAIVYAVGTTTGDFTASLVDRVVEGGQWTDIAVDNSGLPWIVYADSARTGSRDGVRMAYRSWNGTGTAPAGAFSRPLTDPITNTSIVGWEAMTMAADFYVNNDRLNIEAWPPVGVTSTTSPFGGWNGAIGYGSSAMPGVNGKFRIGYFVKPSSGGSY